MEPTLRVTLKPCSPQDGAPAAHIDTFDGIADDNVDADSQSVNS
jgi:hypothetical protein